MDGQHLRAVRAKKLTRCSRCPVYIVRGALILPDFEHSGMWAHADCIKGQKQDKARA